MKTSAAEQRRHDRSALLQWVGIGIVVILGLAAALFLSDDGGGGGGGGHVNAPPIGEVVSTL